MKFIIMILILLLGLPLGAMEKKEKRKGSPEGKKSLSRKKSKKATSEPLDFTTAFQEAYEYTQAKRYQKAINLYKQLLKQDLSEKEKLLCWFNLGRAYEITDQTNLAIDMFSQYLDSKEQIAEFLVLQVKYKLGQLFLKRNINDLGDNNKGEALLLTCANQDTYEVISANACKALFLFYGKQRKQDKAILFARKLIDKKDPRYRIFGYACLALYKGYKDPEKNGLQDLKSLKAALEEALKLYNGLSVKQKIEMDPEHTIIVNRLRRL